MKNEREDACGPSSGDWVGRSVSTHWFSDVRVIDGDTIRVYQKQANFDLMCAHSRYCYRGFLVRSQRPFHRHGASTKPDLQIRLCLARGTYQ
jgi:hypothetical protein